MVEHNKAGELTLGVIFCERSKSSVEQVGPISGDRMHVTVLIDKGSGSESRLL